MVKQTIQRYIVSDYDSGKYFGSINVPDENQLNIKLKQLINKYIDGKILYIEKLKDKHEITFSDMKVVYVRLLKHRQSFNHKVYHLKSPDVSPRVLNHWEKKGLLDVYRIKDTGWRKYNIKDLVWVETILMLRNFGMALESIASIKKGFYKAMNLKTILNDSSWMIIFPSGTISIAGIGSIKESLLDNSGLVINLDVLIEKVFKQQGLL